MPRTDVKRETGVFSTAILFILCALFNVVIVVFLPVECVVPSNDIIIIIMRKEYHFFLYSHSSHKQTLADNQQKTHNSADITSRIVEFTVLETSLTAAQWRT